MKTIIVFLTFFFTGTAFITSAQEFLSSSVRIFQESGEIISSKENEFAIIKLNTNTNLFSIDLCVILVNVNQHDTIEELNQQLSLNFKGTFPIDDLDFYNLPGKEVELYTINGELTINDVIESYSTLNFKLHKSPYPTIYSRDVNSYDYHISFLMEINPIDFCLEILLENCARTIFVEVKDGTINKISNGNEKIGCEMIR